MAYVVPGDAGFPSCPFYEIDSLSDIVNVSPLVIDTDYSHSYNDWLPIWKSGNALVACYNVASTPYIHVDRMTPPGGFGELPGWPYYVIVAFSQKLATPDTYNNYILLYGSSSTDPSSALQSIANGQWTTDNYLYADPNAHSLPSFIVDERDWDESPEQDGDNTADVEGGENADTDPFDFTQNQSVWPDPDMDFISPYATDAHGNPIPGLYTPYELIPAQLQALGAVLYDSDMFDTLVQKLNGSSNPISGILRCIQIPVVTNLGEGSYNICVFGEKLHSENYADPTGAHLRGRWVTKEGGSVTLKEVWGTYRDYTDTQVSIYLPFVGMRQLDPQLCVGKTLSLRCYIDAYTGDVLWLLRSANTGIGGKFYESGGFIGRWSGNCATEIPIGRIDNTRALSTLIGGLTGIALAPVTNGASLAMTGQNLAGMLTGGAQSMGVVSGNVTGHLGTADVLYPYLIVQRSVPQYPNGWRGKIGAVKNQTYSCNDLSGFTLFSQIFLENMEGASGEEIESLKNELCSEGIIF